jgi:hypothetical protein
MASLSKHALVGRVTPVRAVAESGRWRAKDPPALPLLQQNALDGVPLCFMLPRFSRPNRARGGRSCEDGRLRRMNALLLGLESFC